MSDISLGLITLLEADSPVSTRVTSGSTDDRIFPDQLPQGTKVGSATTTLPAIVVEEYTSIHEHQLSGASGVYHPMVRIDCYDATRALANSLAELVRDVLQGFRGAAGVEFIHSCELEGRIKDQLRQDDKSDRPLDRTRLNFRLTVTESIPS